MYTQPHAGSRASQEPPLLLRVQEAAHLLGYSTDTIRRWMDEGTLPRIRGRGRSVRTSRAAVEALASRGVQGGAA